MEINVKKTKSMVASKKQETPTVNISLDGTAIEQVQKKWSTWDVKQQKIVKVKWRLKEK